MTRINNALRTQETGAIMWRCSIPNTATQKNTVIATTKNQSAVSSLSRISEISFLICISLQVAEILQSHVWDQYPCTGWTTTTKAKTIDVVKQRLKNQIPCRMKRRENIEWYLSEVRQRYMNATRECIPTRVNEKFRQPSKKDIVKLRWPWTVLLHEESASALSSSPTAGTEVVYQTQSSGKDSGKCAIHSCFQGGRSCGCLHLRTLTHASMEIYVLTRVTTDPKFPLKSTDNQQNTYGKYVQGCDRTNEKTHRVTSIRKALIATQTFFGINQWNKK